jgi:hypothetical protein
MAFKYLVLPIIAILSCFLNSALATTNTTIQCASHGFGTYVFDYFDDDNTLVWLDDLRPRGGHASITNNTISFDFGNNYGTSFTWRINRLTGNGQEVIDTATRPI